MTKVRLAPEIEDYVNEQVELGAATSAEDYVNTVLRKRRDEEIAAEDELWADVQIGMDDIDSGRFTSVEEAFAEIRERFGLKQNVTK